MRRILAQMGVHAVDAHGRPCDVRVEYTQDWHLWPENAATWSLWARLQTQWRVGMAGATGLDYAAVWAVIDRCLPRRRRDEAFQSIRAMEGEVLKVWAARTER